MVWMFGLKVLVPTETQIRNAVRRVISTPTYAGGTMEALGLVGLLLMLFVLFARSEEQT